MSRKKRKNKKKKYDKKIIKNNLEIKCEICNKVIENKDLRYVNNIILCKNCLQNRKEKCLICRHTKLKGYTCSCQKEKKDEYKFSIFSK